MDSFFNIQDQIELTPVYLSPREAFVYLQDNAAIVDIRPEYEINYRVFDVPKVFYLSYSSYRDKFNIIPKDMFLIVADNVGIRNNEVACFLMAQGYPRVACLAGGVVDWNRDGLPLARDMDYEMIGGCACRLHPKKIRVEGSLVAPK